MNNILNITTQSAMILVTKNKVMKEKFGVIHFDCAFEEIHSRDCVFKKSYYKIIFENAEYLSLFLLSFGELVELYKFEN